MFVARRTPMTWKRLGPLHWIDPETLERHALAAGSGLIATERSLWVVADDLHHLVRLGRQDQLLGEGFRILSGELPQELKARKRAKPDTECLIQLSSHPESLSMLAFPSGSKRYRVRASEIRVDTADKFVGSREIDVSALLGFLSEHIPDLNIGGAVVLGEKVLLFQRGNGKAGVNAVIDFGLDRLEALVHGQFMRATFSPQITEMQLPKITGVSLTFTDACVYEGQVYFSAAAERGSSTYDDGEIIASAIGRMGPRPDLLTQIEAAKVEGLAVARSDESTTTFFAVTDADDPLSPSQLMEVKV
jgi:hypothetical protein